MNSVMRRTGTYLDWLKALLLPTSVRAPNTTVPAPETTQAIDRDVSSDRAVEHTLLLVAHFSALDDAGGVDDVDSMPAGAFHTPRRVSVRA